jgi:hypothetical protein
MQDSEFKFLIIYIQLTSKKVSVKIWSKTQNESQIIHEDKFSYVNTTEQNLALSLKKNKKGDTLYIVMYKIFSLVSLSVCCDKVRSFF